MATKTTLDYEGCNYFRQRIIIATLNNRPVKIKKVRDKDVDPGVKGRNLRNFIHIVIKDMKTTWTKA